LGSSGQLFGLTLHQNIHAEVSFGRPIGAGSGTVTNRAFDANTGALTGVAAGTGSSVANLAFGFDALGNLTSRGDANLSTAESFAYDGLNRLTSAQVAGQAAHSVGYDALGNITSKTRLDTNSLLNIYSYPAAGSARPHAVASISGLVNGVLNPTYTYDADGNLTAGAGRAVTWTSFNKVASIVQGSTTMSYAYDADHARITQTEVSGGVTTTTTYLNDPASGLSSEKTVSGSTTTWTDYLFAGGARVGERVITVGGATTLKYFIADHLGSVSVITDGSGAVLERLSYDAWGKRRNANGTDDPANSVTSAVTRGFSDHEMIASVGLVNMNARIYDPELGRMMSADPVIDSIFVSQVLNRYSYVGNNPLSITDMSGYSWLSSLFRSVPILRSIVAIAVAITLHVDILPALGIAKASLANAFLSGFISGGVSGGNLNSALVGGLQASAFLGIHTLGIATNTIGGAIESAALHGFVGGLASVAQGSKFGSGFISAGFTDLAGPILIVPGETARNAIAHAIVGGLASILGGGKFENGAITGAFGYLYNRANAGIKIVDETTAHDGAARVAEARAYTETTKDGKLLWGWAEESGMTITVQDNLTNAWGGNLKVLWDPRLAIRFKGGTISPALVLMHEIVHALQTNGLRDMLRNMPDPDYENKAEAKAIQYENSIASELGEDIRPCHCGTGYPVSGPTSRDPMAPDVVITGRRH